MSAIAIFPVACGPDIFVWPTLMSEATTQSNDDPQERRAIEQVQRGDSGAYDYLVAK